MILITQEEATGNFRYLILYIYLYKSIGLGKNLMQFNEQKNVQAEKQMKIAHENVFKNIDILSLILILIYYII